LFLLKFNSFAQWKGAHIYMLSISAQVFFCNVHYCVDFNSLEAKNLDVWKGEDLVFMFCKLWNWRKRSGWMFGEKQRGQRHLSIFLL